MTSLTPLGLWPFLAFDIHDFTSLRSNAAIGEIVPDHTPGEP